MFEAVAIYPAGAAVLGAIAKAVGPEKLGEQAGSGVVGNLADRILVTGLAGTRYAWRRFRENCGRLDAPENHVLFRALVGAHWSAVAQGIAVYGRSCLRSNQPTFVSSPYFRLNEKFPLSTN